MNLCMSHSELSKKVLDCLRREGVKPGFHIREQWLADALGVSRSPVRNALKQLESFGIVQLKPSRGFFLTAEPGSEAFEEANLPQPETERIYAQIVSERFANLLGDQVSVADLVRRYGVGRSAINKVLARMQEDGLVEKSSGHNWIFGPALNDESAYQESYRFRLLLEPAAILEPGFSLPAKQLALLRRTHEDAIATGPSDVPIQRLLDIDAGFHNALADACGNRFIAQSIRQQSRLRRLSEYQKYIASDRLTASLQEHLGILDSLRRNAHDEAARRLADHIRASDKNRLDFRKVRILAHRRLTRL